MQLSQLILSAMRELEEDPNDVDELRDRFMLYANQAYHTITADYVKPREKRIFETDERGCIPMPDELVRRVVSLRDDRGRIVPFTVSEDGETLLTDQRNKTLHAVVEIAFPDLVRDSDEPQTPRRADQAIIDWICYRYLISGNLAKQARAAVYLQQYNQTCALLRPRSTGSVTAMRGLYEASDIHNYRQ